MDENKHVPAFQLIELSELQDRITEEEDMNGMKYTMREPLDPGEIGQLYRLFFEENYPKRISEMDKHFVQKLFTFLFQSIYYTPN